MFDNGIGSKITLVQHQHRSQSVGMMLSRVLWIIFCIMHRFVPGISAIIGIVSPVGDLGCFSIAQLTQSELSSLKGGYYSAQLFECRTNVSLRDE